MSRFLGIQDDSNLWLWTISQPYNIISFVLNNKRFLNNHTIYKRIEFGTHVTIIGYYDGSQSALQYVISPRDFIIN